MKYSIFLLGFIFSFLSGSAQTHDYTNAGCRYFKCPPGQHCAIEEGRPGCPACRKDFDDEIKAVAEESKRKADEKAAQELVEKQKKDEELKKIAEQRKADENNKISIVSPTPPQVQEKQMGMANNITDKTIMIPLNPRRENNWVIGCTDTSYKVLFYLDRKNRWDHIWDFQHYSYSLQYPRNLVIGGKSGQKLGTDYFNRDYSPYSMDIINSTGKNEFDNIYVTGITHISGNWFLVGVDNTHDPAFHKYADFIYNYKTKIKIPLSRITSLGISTYIYSHELDNYAASFIFIPVFSEKEELKIIEGDSKLLKKLMIKNFPARLNEELLKTSEFCIISTSNVAKYIAACDDAQYEQKWRSTLRVEFIYVKSDGSVVKK